MLDLGYVRANLELVKKKLGNRGMDPALVLGRFEELDLHRRSSISQSETNKAQQNQLSQDIAKLRRAGGDATLLASCVPGAVLWPEMTLEGIRLAVRKEALT